MGGTGVIDNFLGTFTQYIDSGFGLVQGDVRWLAGVLIGIDITLAGLFWALVPDEDVLARLIRKTLYIGVFAFIIGNFNNLAQIIYNSFAGLGIEAGGGTISTAQLLQPGKLAQVGIDAGKPILTSISGMMGFTSVFENLVQIIILLVAWMIVVVSFFIMAIQLFVSLIEFKLTTLAGFVLVPFGLFGRTTFLAEKVLGNVVSSGVKILVLAVIVGIGQQIFGQFTNGFNNPPTISDALTLILASLALFALTIFGPGIANGLISGGPQLGAGAAIGTGLAVAGVGAAGVGLAAAGVGAVGAAAGVAAGAARGGATLAGAATTAYRAGGLSGVAEAAASSAGNTAMSPLRRAAASMRESFAAGSRSAAAGPAGSGEGAAPGAAAGSSSPPAWARRMRRNQAISQGASAAHRAIQSGDHPSSGTGVDLSEGE
ncbi:conjugal transfer protein TrbL [Aliidongia dinghuensis]|uniref:Conjugal transfer protein TrbL n=1 Tax=Aliidongia dinghuensis TaxID=1867774 RepID=A0A8J3E7B1_9PROT|nr:P-type conjugative transfer protein TrbL [Aliidongia dinghuensis]GGF50456.1 conjugal transfer protein TrbL [Aliidongia dinghuensis]